MHKLVRRKAATIQTPDQTGKNVQGVLYGPPEDEKAFTCGACGNALHGSESITVDVAVHMEGVFAVNDTARVHAGCLAEYAYEVARRFQLELEP